MRRTAGSTLFELVVVLFILGSLVAILAPMFAQARERSAMVHCADQLRVIGRAMLEYAREHKGRLPATRPLSAPVVLPDVTSAGRAATNPYLDEGPGPNNVPSAVFLLIREDRVSPKRLVCPGSEQTPDPLDSQSPLRFSNFRDTQRNLSYGMQNPYADEEVVRKGYQWTVKLPAEFPLMADRGPGIVASGSEGNSRNHGGRGQNLLFADGSVAWRTTPLAGVDNDHIYQTRDGKVLGSPRDPLDSILLPQDKAQ